MVLKWAITSTLYDMDCHVVRQFEDFPLGKDESAVLTVLSGEKLAWALPQTSCGSSFPMKEQAYRNGAV